MICAVDRMLLKDIQNLEVAVGVNVHIFYLSMVFAVAGIVLSVVCVFFSLVLLLWCETHSISSLWFTSGVQRAGQFWLTSQAML